MEKVNQNINGDSNIQIAGDCVVTSKHTTKVEVRHDPNLHVSDAEAHQIKEKVDNVVKILSKGNENDTSKLYRKVYNALYKKFHCTKYTLIPKGDFDNAILFLSKYKGINFSRRNLTQLQRVDRYKAIHSKFNKLGMSKEDMYQCINEYLSHKKYYSSLTELSDAALNKVYFYFMKM